MLGGWERWRMVTMVTNVERSERRSRRHKEMSGRMMDLASDKFADSRLASGVGLVK